MTQSDKGHLTMLRGNRGTNIEWRGEVWQSGMRVAMVEGKSFHRVNAETAHYAMMYSQDGEVKVKITKRKLRRKTK